MTNKIRRLLLGFSGLFSWALILFAWLYLEKTLYLNPCPLCMIQRVAFALVGFFFLTQAVCWPRGWFFRTILRIFTYLSIFFGIALAARHLYIQNLPPGQAPACGFDFWGMLSHSGFWGGIWKSIQGTGECTTVDSFMGLAIPAWSMAAFAALLVIAIICGQRRN